MHFDMIDKVEGEDEFETWAWCLCNEQPHVMAHNKWVKGKGWVSPPLVADGYTARDHAAPEEEC